MKERYWNDTITDGDRKRRRQAEFLVHEFFPFQFILGIGVIIDKIALQVEQYIDKSRFNPDVKVEQAWYY